MRRRSSAQTIAIPLLVALAVLLAGASGLSAADVLNGAGESWPGPAVDKLRRDAESETAPFGIGFINVGETQARAEVAAADADFAVTSVGLSDGDKQTASTKGRTIAYAPYMGGAVAIVVALDVQDAHGGGRIQKLNLTVPTLAKIYTHQISVWNDPEIKAQNPDQPNLDNLRAQGNSIIFVARKDTSSSTAALISLFLSDPEAKVVWNAYAKFFGAPENTPLDAWPSDSDSHADLRTDGSAGVMDRMLGLNPDGTKIPQYESHHIGYVAPSWVKVYNNAAPLVTLTSKDASHATKIDPTPEAVAKAMNKGTFDPTTNLVTLNYTIDADGAWPIPLVSYFAVPTKGLPAVKATPLSKFIKFALSDAGQKAVTDTDYAPVPAALKTAALKVADDVAAQTTSASTTSTTAATGATGSTTSTTATTIAGASTTGPSAATVLATSASPGASPAETPSTTPGAAGAPTPGAGGSVSAASADPPLLAATGKTTAPLVVLAALLAFGGEVARRRVRH